MDTKSADSKPSTFQKIGAIIVTIGTIISTIGAIASTVITIEGYVSSKQEAVSPQLHSIVHQQLAVKSPPDSISLNACVIRNEGNANAEKVLIHIGSKENLIFRDVDIEGDQRNWTVQGGTGESYAEISLPDLIATYVMTVTVRTDEPITFFCAVADATGPVKRPVQNIFSLQGWDFGVLFLGGGVSTVLGIILAYFLIGKALERRLSDSSKR